ncbi:MAG: Crp/Fnr family transcriptional regulator, partial [Bacteroidota bacterium]
LEKSMFSQLHTTAQQRFENLLKEEPTLFNNVPLQYIASMLGITPESLSRLRKKLVKPIS